MLNKLREWVRPYYLRNIYFPLFPDRVPPYFAQSWSYPEAHVEADPNTPVILFLSMNDWHTRTQRTEHFARALSVRGYRCVYLNVHLGREFPGRFDQRRPSRVTCLAEDVFELHVHLPREPVFHHRPLAASESARIAGAVTELIQRFGSPRLVQIMSFPVWLEAARLLRDRHRAPIFYDCHDFLPGFSGVTCEIIDREPETFCSSDLNFCSSQNLMERAHSFAPNTRAVLLRNATAREFFQVPRNPSSRVVIGYIGALDSWFDTRSVEAVAVAHSEWNIQLIGRVESDAIRALDRFPNVECIGEVPFAQLGAYLSGFTVGVIPFVLNPLIAATDPIKAYEYLAAGLPVVSANLPELDRFGYLIARYLNPSDFTHKLEMAIASDSPALTARRRAAAAKETWDARADELVAQIVGELNR